MAQKFSIFFKSIKKTTKNVKVKRMCKKITDKKK